MKSSRLFHWTASLVLASLCLGGSIEAASKKLLVVTVTKGFRHSSIPTAESVLGALAAGSSHFEVDYARTDEEIAEAECSHAGTYLEWLHENDEDAYEELLIERATPWGGMPTVRAGTRQFALRTRTMQRMRRMSSDPDHSLSQ